jgi:polyphosphate kinase 2
MARSNAPEVPHIKSAHYERDLLALQIELVKLQRHIIDRDDRILVLFEGRDAAGKDGTIKRITQHLSPRETRVVALGKPSDREMRSWYFQRFVRYLPTAQEMVLFNRSWYNRAGVERVMGFCTEKETAQFLEAAPTFEHMLTNSGIKLFKFYLEIDRAEQKKRLKNRREDPLKQWKISPVDRAAQKHWADYSRARNEMFARTHTTFAPWTVVRADNKRAARLNVIRHLLSHLDYAGKRQRLIRPDAKVIFRYDEAYLKNGMIVP